ncbi:Protein piwi [Folsomia candida]|uniref:Protein piwi n=2 Tax=Folsomia candida TaxID=158441 RepID=A0A226DM40_FOLCA|nr:Protein piwi [Folsomia candida]
MNPSEGSSPEERVTARGRSRPRNVPQPAVQLGPVDPYAPPPMEIEPAGNAAGGPGFDQLISEYRADSSNGSGNGSEGGREGSSSPEEQAFARGRGRGGRSRDEPRRTGMGKSGTVQRFFVNYFQLQMKKTIEFRLYLVNFDPEIDHIPKRKALLRMREADIGPYLFEGTQLFTTRIIPIENLRFEASFPDKPDDVWTVNIDFIRQCDRREPVVTQLYNVLLKKAQETLALTLLGRFYFDSEQKIDIRQHRLQLWPGFVTSIRQMERDVYLNVDPTFKVCRTETVFDLMKEMRQTSRNFKGDIEAAVIGTVVMTTYNKKTYKITGINWDIRPTGSFTVSRGGVESQVTFVEYFEKKGIRLNASQPMLVSAPTKRDIRRGDVGDKILPPEICYQTGLNDEMRSNFRLMKDLAGHLHMAPQQRIQQTVQFVRRMIESEEVTSELLAWGMRIQGVPCEIPGRLLDQESIRFKSGQAIAGEAADWTMAFRTNQMLLAKPMQRWAIVYPNRDSDGIDNLLRTMDRVGRPLGFPVGNPIQVGITATNERAYTEEIERLVEGNQGRLDLIMIILPNPNLSVYAAVKKACSLNYGIPSQCFLSKNVTSKGLMSISTKLVIQMNAKLGGQPWGLANPLKGLMVIGFDVHHGGGRSYGAMTATTSQNMASYFSTVLTLSPGLEMAGEIGLALRKCLQAYRARNDGEFPARIMFYRDGVGEGQLRYVVETELVALQSAITDYYGDQDAPKFSMVIVTKRINTRMFLAVGKDNRVANPPPGSIIDDIITCPEKYDFYLVPQTARQGTVSPVGFNIIHDTSGLDADKMQRFSFKLCHGYFNWSGTVAVPAPCQYAHKLAFLTGTALLNEAREPLLNNLHYL